MAMRLSLPASYSWQPQTFPALSQVGIGAGLVEAFTVINGQPVSVTERGPDFARTITIVTAGTPAASWLGNGISYNGSSQTNRNTTANAPSPLNVSASHLDEFSAMTLLVPRAIASTFLTACVYGNGPSGQRSLTRFGQGGSANQLRWLVVDAAGTSQSLNGTHAQWANNTPAVAIGTRSESANFARLYCNGQVVVDTTPTAMGACVFNGSQWGALEGAQYWNGIVHLLAVWTRALRADEIMSLSVNPWQIFSYPSRPLFLDTGAGAAATFAPPPRNRTVRLIRPRARIA